MAMTYMFKIMIYQCVLLHRYTMCVYKCVHDIAEARHHHLFNTITPYKVIVVMYTRSIPMLKYVIGS